jgi:response regulator RpfG family c-di-GMP phosphodiesterase
MVIMSGSSVLLCIHQRPSELSLLHKNGYELVMTASSAEGLRLLQARPFNAALVDHRVCQSEGAAVANQIKRIRPELPVIILVNHLELPVHALQSADAVVAKSDGDHFLWATVHFLLNVKPIQRQQRFQAPKIPMHMARSLRAIPVITSPLTKELHAPSRRKSGGKFEVEQSDSEPD